MDSVGFASASTGAWPLKTTSPSPVRYGKDGHSLAGRLLDTQTKTHGRNSGADVVESAHNRTRAKCRFIIRARRHTVKSFTVARAARWLYGSSSQPWNSSLHQHCEGKGWLDFRAGDGRRRTTHHHCIVLWCGQGMCGGLGGGVGGVKCCHILP